MQKICDAFMREFNNTAEDRLLRFINFISGPTAKRLDTRCWLWTGAANQQGHGMFTFGGRSNARSAYIAAFRFHYFDGGIINLAGYVMAHKCDTPSCVRPTHLYLTTPTGNARDRVCSEAERLYREALGDQIRESLMEMCDPARYHEMLLMLHNEMTGENAYRRAFDTAWANSAGTPEL